MQEIPAVTGNSGDDGGSTQSQQQPAQGGGGNEFGGGGGSIGGGFTDDGERRSGGNRWLRQETMALIKIRSDMDAAFRDSNLKSPLWDEVSRKLSELGFHRTSMKCREKFENVYKYHKRTKEGRTSKSDNKTYRFFDQLQALEGNPDGGHPFSPPIAMKPPPIAVDNNNVVVASTTVISQAVTIPFTVTIPSVVSPSNATVSHQNISPISVAAPAVTTMSPLSVTNHKRTLSFLQSNMSGSTNSASSSYISSNDDLSERKKKRKKRWKNFIGKLMKELIEKQEELQTKFLDTLEKRDQDRATTEEARRVQEIMRMNREHDLLAHERSIAVTKNTAVVTFLQKITEKNPEMLVLQRQQQQLQQEEKQQIQQPMPPAQKQPPQQPVVIPAFVPPPPPPPMATSSGDILLPSPSRWPKAEINALITIRTTLDMKHHENGLKGPLWEEVSAAMRRLGHNRNPKRCKEKWENINKYYKKVKEGSKKRLEDSKTCPYFDQLDAIYKQKVTQMTPIIAPPEQQWPQQQPTPVNAVYKKAANYPGSTVKSETQIAPITAQPEQQWPPPPVVVQGKQQPPSTAELEDVDDCDDDEYEDEEDDGVGYEIVPSKIASMTAV